MTQRISGKFVQYFGDLKTEDLLPVTLESLLLDLEFAYKHGMALEVKLTFRSIDYNGKTFKLSNGPEVVWQDLCDRITTKFKEQYLIDVVPCMRWYGREPEKVTLWLRNKDNDG